MTRFADQSGVERDNADIELDVAIFRAFDAFADREVTVPEKVAAFAHAVNFGDNEASGISAELGPAPPSATARRSTSTARDSRAMPAATPSSCCR